MSKLERELENFVELMSLERMHSELSAVRTVLGQLRQVVCEFGFVSQGEEIGFFKTMEPRFYQLVELSDECYGFEMSRLVRMGKKKERFYIRQLEYIDLFFASTIFYQYYRFGSTELDSLYIVRGYEPFGVLEAHLPPLDLGFVTIGD